MVAGLVFVSMVLGRQSAYADPDRAFAVQVPAGYRASRQQLEQGVFLTDITKGGIGENPQLSILSYSTGQSIDPSQHRQLNTQTLDAMKSVIGSEVTVTKDARSDVTFNGRAAIRSDFGFKDDDGAAWKGWILAQCGSKNAVGVFVCAKSSDASGYQMIDAAARTFAIESSSPFAAGSSPNSASSTLSSGNLKELSARIKGNMKREPMAKVLVPGEPALTYGSVANFVTFVELIFDMQLTEAEFDATRERFIEFYKKGDAAGKKVLALQGAEMLKSVTMGSAAEIAKNKQDSRKVFSSAFEQGAQAGIGYAQVMWDAVQRRTQKLAKAKQKPKKQEWDTDVTQADIDATIEMLYFMWVASGRDPNDVTPAEVVKLKTSIVREYATFDPEVQIVIANAPKIYAAIRQKWQSASASERAMMARQFSNSLDSLGLREGGSFEQSGGGGGGGSDLAAIAQNTAWNAAKTWSTTSGG